MQHYFTFRKFFEYIKEYDGAYHEAFIIYCNVPIMYSAVTIKESGKVDVAPVRWQREIQIDLYFFKFRVMWETKEYKNDYPLPDDFYSGSITKLIDTNL